VGEFPDGKPPGFARVREVQQEGTVGILELAAQPSRQGLASAQHPDLTKDPAKKSRPENADGIREKRTYVIYKHLLLFIGIFLGSRSLGAAQIAAPPMVEVAGNVSPILTMMGTAPTPVPVELALRYRDSRQAPRRVKYLLGGTYKSDPSIASMLPIATVKSLIFASSSLPLVQLFGGKVELDAFQSTSRIPYAQRGPVGNAGARDFHLPQQGYPGESRSLHLSGISLNFRFGGNWRSGTSLHAWRYLPRILSAVLN
jgi:hypothetical protein